VARAVECGKVSAVAPRPIKQAFPELTSFGLRGHGLPALPLARSGEPHADAAALMVRVNATLEAWIRDRPEPPPPVGGLRLAAVAFSATAGQQLFCPLS